MGSKASASLISALTEAYEKLKSGPMKKSDLMRHMGYKGCNSPDAILTRFESHGMRLWEEAGQVGRMEE